ncbi:transposase [Roseibium sp. TrichSKD4]|uniref:transposase domain-containing protein n=1 Tax=Roseibium sp. TrichSKD4 TaxID=744980 RepID=UPI0001E57057|nr:transposase domain-containing protein [Roseibium sp. TrichSKD4]EFO31644.1 transposase [Roseibium sp. TrichSKD4]
MKEWFSFAELAEAKLPDMPHSVRGLSKMADRQGWSGHSRLVPGTTKPTKEYHVCVLPEAAQLRLAIIMEPAANDEEDPQAAERRALWERFNGLSNAQKQVCKDRLKILERVTKLEAAGLAPVDAVKLAAKEAELSRATVYNWRSQVLHREREDWLAALAPSTAKAAEFADCHPDLFEMLKSDFLRPEKPSFSACYRRVKDYSKKNGLEPLPSERSLRRRLDHEVSKAVQTMARSGKEKAKALFPAQRRTRRDLHALQMVNMDGHKFDVFVTYPGRKKPGRPCLLAIQDLYSGKIVSWRLSETENKETVRLAIGDVVEAYGIFEDIYLDNGRGFAAKWISGGAKTRFRFKVKDEDPEGLLVALGVNVHFTTPYSGQSKPIERAFRDLTDTISRHPFCAGAYTGRSPEHKPDNYMSRAIPFDAFKAFVAERIRDHNAQVGRSAENCAGRSFDETFRASIEAPGTIIRVASPSQRALWLLASETIKTHKGSGEVRFQGNRYWSRELNQHMGGKVVIRFDPDNLHLPVKVYDLNNRWICDAPCIDDVGFKDETAAREHARNRRELDKAVKAQRDLHTRLSARQLADLYAPSDEKAVDPEPIRPAVTRLIPGKIIDRPAPSEEPEADTQTSDFEDSFSRAMSKVGFGSVLDFPEQNSDPAEPKCNEYGDGDIEPKSSEYGSERRWRG